MEFSLVYVIFPLALIVAFALMTATVKILRQYERAMVFTLGRFQRAKGPGLVLMIPFIQEMVRVGHRRHSVGSSIYIGMSTKSVILGERSSTA
jgi:regulator of protease activity HflC (stomatin/prohibitin superfamily)